MDLTEDDIETFRDELTKRSLGIASHWQHEDGVTFQVFNARVWSALSGSPEPARIGQPETLHHRFRRYWFRQGVTVGRSSACRDVDQGDPPQPPETLVFGG
ncbi:hypothetical protein J7E68_18995, partial [Microbacterium sp. ISL-103]|uniref:hypothetical protein n=1 Tax=Microbacterium sp. ISL-103 TaxID=2819156 RepID=UPI001BE7ECD8